MYELLQQQKSVKSSKPDSCVRWFKYISVSAVETLSEMSVFWNHLISFQRREDFIGSFPLFPNLQLSFTLPYLENDSTLNKGGI